MSTLRNLGITLGLLIAGHTCAVPLASAGEHQSDAGDTSKFIAEVFRLATGNVPQLGWVVPEVGVVATLDAEQVFVMSTQQQIVVASRKNTIFQKESSRFIKAHHVACDVPTGGPVPMQLFVYSVTSAWEQRNPQVFLLEHTFPGLTAGYREFTPLESSLAAVWAQLQPKSPEQLRKAYSVEQDKSGFFLTFAALYDGPRQEMSKKGVFLQRKDGTVIGAEIQPIGTETTCDGCATPNYRDPSQADSPVMNVFTAPTFPFPIVMLDISTVEGRAISLMTFTDKAQPSEYRVYEYVGNCS
jgi:hypothetical protein